MPNSDLVNSVINRTAQQNKVNNFINQMEDMTHKHEQQAEAAARQAEREQNPDGTPIPKPKIDPRAEKRLNSVEARIDMIFNDLQDLQKTFNSKVNEQNRTLSREIRQTQREMLKLQEQFDRQTFIVQKKVRELSTFVQIITVIFVVVIGVTMILVGASAIMGIVSG